MEADVRNQWNVEIECTQGQGTAKALTSVIAPPGWSKQKIKKRLTGMLSEDGSVRCSGPMIFVGTVYVLSEQ
jgi:ABC-type cobalamin transport system ATPase subunit